MGNRYSRIIISLLFLLCSFVSHAQSVTRVRGIVKDADTGEPVPFVSIVFPGTTIGTSTDLEGLYSLETRERVDKVQALLISYESQTAEIVYGEYNRIDFSLKPIVESMESIKVTPGINPAHAILDSVSHYKYRNDPSRMDTYQYNAYTKMELDLVNVSGFKGKRMQRDFGFIFEHIDTSAITGHAYLPVMITESTSDYYYRRSPRMNREVIKASRISGLDDYNFSQFTGGMYVDVNLYENYINIFEVTIPSPLCDHGRMFYNYYLIDSMQVDNRKTYYIRFHPKNVATPVFDGEINIDAGEWALLSARMRLAKGINVNWLRNVYIENHNQRLDKESWFRKQDKLLADFAVTKSDSSELMSFMAQRQIDYSDVRINEEIPPDILKQSNNVIYLQSSINDDERFWADVRPYELSDKETNIYRMVDSIKNVPRYQNIYDLMTTLFMGYQKAGPVEFGSIYRLFSFNGLEGGRVQAGMRTNKDFHKKMRLSGYAAYGFKDTKLKGGGSLEYEFSSLPYSKLTVSAKHDVLQMSAGRDLFAHGNIFSSVFSRGDNKRLVMMNQAMAHYEKELSPSFSGTLAADWRELMPTRYMEFMKPDGTELKKIRSTEISIGARFAKDEIVHRRAYEKLHFYSPFPVLNLELTAGLKNIFSSDYEYYRAVASMHYKFNIPPMGRSILDVSAGKVFGKVPYPMLKLHEGNATYFYDPTSYSCMDFYEFASDAWVSVFYEHHFRGFFLGRIPLLKRLQWREVFILKALWGTISDKNDGSYAGHQAIIDFPKAMSSVSKPYVEVGVGIENIFKMFRIDAIWRLTHRHSDVKKISNFVINASIKIDF